MNGYQYIKGAIPKKPAGEKERAPEPAGKPEDAAAASKARTEELKSVVKQAMEEVVGLGKKQVEPLSESEAQRIFAVLRKLRTETGVRKAPLHAVFEFMVLQGLSGEETARRCKCAPSLISARVKMLRERFGMSVRQLQSYASALAEMETTVKGDRRRKKSAGRPNDFDHPDGTDVSGDGWVEGEEGDLEDREDDEAR